MRKNEATVIRVIATFRTELSSAPCPSRNQRSASEFDRCRKRQEKTQVEVQNCSGFWSIGPVLSSPEAERGSPGEEDGLGLRLGLLKEPEEGVVLHADLPEDLAAVSAGHGELQRVVVGVLLRDAHLKCESGRTKHPSKKKRC